MFGKLRDYFLSDSQVSLETDQFGTPTDEDLQIATAVLLVEVASSDKRIAEQEGATLVAMLARHFDIKYTDLEALVQAAIKARQSADKIDVFVNSINEHFSAAQKQKVLAMLWTIMIADGKVDKLEERLLTQMKFRFRLTEEEAQEARRMAESGEL